MRRRLLSALVLLALALSAGLPLSAPAGEGGDAAPPSAGSGARPPLAEAGTRPPLALAWKDNILTVHGKIYLVLNDVAALVARYEKDFPEHKALHAQSLETPLP